MTELGRQPMCFAWLKQAAKMWNKFCSRNISDLARIALVESAEMASVPRKRERVGWVTQLNKTLHLIGGPTLTDVGQLLDIGAIMRLAAEKWQHRIWNKLPTYDIPVRDVPDRDRNGFKLYVYKRWFEPEDWLRKESFLFHLFHRGQVKSVAQFRMGVHWLNTECLSRNIPRSKRYCECCSNRIREDEMHFLECPAYIDVRRLYPASISASRLLSFVSQLLSRLLAGFFRSSPLGFPAFPLSLVLS